MEHACWKRIAVGGAAGACIGMAVLPGSVRAQATPSEAVSEAPISDGCAGKAWVNLPPKADDTNYYFTGRSGRFATEKEARNDANIDATNQFVQFTGVHVSVLDQVLQEGRAKSSELLDPTITAKRRQELRAEAFVSRVKAQEYCTFRFQRTQGRVTVGIVYVTNALVAVPRDEFDRVRERIDDLQRKQQGQEQARRAAAIADARALIEAAHSDESAGRLLSALQNLASARKQLEESEAIPGSTFIPTGMLAPGTALSAHSPVDCSDRGIIEMVQKGKTEEEIHTICVMTPTEAQVTSAERRLLAGLSLQPVNPDQQIDPGQAPSSLVVQATYAGPPTVPVSGLPIVFAMGTAAFVPLRTGPTGRVELPLSTTPENRRIVASIDLTDFKDQISPAAEAALQGVRAAFLVQVRERSLDERLADLVRQLAPPPGSPRMEVVIGNFTFGKTQAAGTFSEQVKAGLVTALGQQRDRFVVMEPKPITRGLTLVAANSEGAIAQAAGAKANLSGDYQVEGDWLVIHGRLVSAQNGEVLGAAATRMRKASVNEEDLAPPNVSQAAQVAQVMTAAAAPGGFKLDLGIDKGNGATYREGEDIHIFVQCAVACYMKLIYVEADGTRVRLVPSTTYPNAFLPVGEKKTFDFTVTGNPFGAESVVAFASTAPLPDDPGHEREGLWVIDDKLDSIASRTRGVTSQTKGRESERSVTLTTLKKAG